MRLCLKVMNCGFCRFSVSGERVSIYSIFVIFWFLMKKVIIRSSSVVMMLCVVDRVKLVLKSLCFLLCR